MEAKHSLLRRQLKRHIAGDLGALPASCHAFLAAVDEAYAGFDGDRQMLERSLELSSQELLQATADTRAMFQAIPDLLIRTDRDGAILAVKSGADAELLGPAQPLIGQKIDRVISGDGAARLRSAMAHVHATKAVVTVDFALNHGASHHDYEARLVPTLDEQIVVIIRNITERKRTEEVLRTTRQQLERVLSQSPTVVYSFAIKDGKITPAYISANVTTMLGYDPPAILRRLSTREGIHPDDRARAEAEMAQLFAQSHATHDFRFQHKTGSYRWLRDEQRLLRDAAGDPVEIVGSWTDVTERVELEAQLRQVQKMEAIGRLAGGVAHDFNNLLTVIGGYADLLLTETISAEESRELLHELSTVANRATRLTQQLLAFSRKQPIQLQQLDLNRVVGDLGRMLQRIIGEDVSLSFAPAPDLPYVRADAGMLEQVVLNLAVNARDAMPEGGKLYINTRRVTVPAGTTHNGTEVRAGDYACLGVRDTGCGMTAETMGRIFEPFFTTKEAGKGTGLGLATVYGIVQQHEGWVDVQSEPGNGSTFSVYLPVTTLAVKARSETTKRPHPANGTETILLVEDERSVRQYARIVLQRSGYRVMEVGSAPAALELWKAHAAEIDLLLTDIILPDGQSGPRLASRLKAEKPALKVVFASGYTPHDAPQALQLQPGTNFLQKPYLPGALSQLVRDTLDGRTPAEK